MAQRKFKIDGGFSTDDASELLADLTMGGTIDMAGSKVLNVGDPTVGTDVASKTYVDTLVSDTINGAPGALDTLNELAAALGDDASFSTTVTNSIATKAAITYVDGLKTASDTYADAAQTAAEATAVAADTVVTTAFQNADATNLVTAASDASMKADAAEVNAINTADTDATTKANAAQSAAEATAVAADAVVTAAFGAADAVVTSAYIAADAVVTSAYIAGDVSTLSSAATASEAYTDEQFDLGDPGSELSSFYTTVGMDISNESILSINVAAVDATNKADAAQAAAISSASSDATTKANAARTGAVADVTNGAGAAFDTLVEIQNAMATDAELSSAIASVTSSAASTAAADATSKANAALASALAADSDTTYSVGDGQLSEINFTSADHSKLNGIAASATNVTNNNQLTNGAGYITGYTDTNTTYTAGNGMTLSGTSFLMSGSYTGNFSATGDITAYSDDSLKTNVQVIDGALGRVEAIRGVTFERIEDGSVSTGVIAQELKAVLPEAVHTDANGIHSVAYGNITGLLIEAVKELSAQVAELKAK